MDGTLTSGGLYGRDSVYSKFIINMKVPNVKMPKLNLIEKVNILRTDQFIQDKVAGKGTTLLKIKIPEIKLCKGRIQIFSEDEDYARKIVKDNEFQRLLSDWYYAYIKTDDNTITLILDDVNVLNKYKKRLQTPDYLVQALDICAKIGELSK
jgi:hypothetical protein